MMISPERSYADYREMAVKEAQRPDGIDAVVIATPPDSHLDIAKCFLNQGIDVICEKPLTRNVEEAEQLAELVKSTDRLFCVTHCYTGYPMVRHARNVIAEGAIGAVRMIEVEFCPGEPGTALEPLDPSKRHWRFKEGYMGKAAILGEVGSHAYNIASYLTGRRAIDVSARLRTFAERREVFDNAYLTVRYDNGVEGRLWSSYVAAGNDQGLKFRIFGDHGSLLWDQESPETLTLKRIGEPAVILGRGYDSASDAAKNVTRFRAGFPEGYGLAFANLYVDFANALMARELGVDPDEHLRFLPTVQDGLEGMKMIAAAVRSNNSDGQWSKLGEAL
ncbi:Gfo/Idh/MocA family protein [Rhizobium sp. NPDC090275]|uniref:Gfo/Idh/MocA family protein n=1 Tax=Rhizobium sp. NPDC090275 TaxID=3364498 RepID=UPI00383ABF1D